MAKYNVKTQSLTLTEIIRKYHFISDACGEDLGNISVEKVFQPHEKIVVQGEPGDEFFIILEVKTGQPRRETGHWFSVTASVLGSPDSFS